MTMSPERGTFFAPEGRKFITPKGVTPLLRAECAKPRPKDAGLFMPGGHNVAPEAR